MALIRAKLVKSLSFQGRKIKRSDRKVGNSIKGALQQNQEKIDAIFTFMAYTFSPLTLFASRIMQESYPLLSIVSPVYMDGFGGYTIEMDHMLSCHRQRQGLSTHWIYRGRECHDLC